MTIEIYDNNFSLSRVTEFGRIIIYTDMGAFPQSQCRKAADKSSPTEIAEEGWSEKG